MKMVEMNGGLGNQILQYVYGRFLEGMLGYEIYYDLMLYDCVRYMNGFELTDVFPNVKFKSVRSKFDMDVWVEMINICKKSGDDARLPYVLLQSGSHIIMIMDEYHHRNLVNGVERYTGFDGPRYLVDSDYLHNIDMNLYHELNGYDVQHLYFKGVWFNPNIATPIKHLLKEELKFPELEDEQNIQYRDDMLSKEVAVGIHVRRGDFVTFNKVADADKYSETVRKLKRDLMKQQVSNAGFYVFSDDIPWCKENIETLGLTDNDCTVFIEGNEVSRRNYLDMQLMSYCDYLIHDAESSFAIGATHGSEKDIVRITVDKFKR